MVRPRSPGPSARASPTSTSHARARRAATTFPGRSTRLPSTTRLCRRYASSDITTWGSDAERGARHGKPRASGPVHRGLQPGPKSVAKMTESRQARTMSRLHAYPPDLVQYVQDHWPPGRSLDVSRELLGEALSVAFQ